MTDGVVRRAERAQAHERRLGRKLVSDRIDAGHIQGFVDGHFRQDARQGARHQRFPRPGRTDHQHVVPTRGSHFKRPLGVFLPLDLSEIGRRDGRHGVRLDVRLGRDDLAPGQVVIKLGERSDRDHFQVRDECGFSSVHFGDNDALETVLAGGGGHRQHAARVAYGAVQREFAHHQHAFGGFGQQHAGVDEHPHGDRQVVRRPFLADRGRGKVDHQPFARHRHPGVANRRLDPFAAFLHRRVGQTHHGHAGQALGVVHFHFDDHAVESDHCTGVYARKHGVSVGEKQGDVNRLSDHRILVWTGRMSCLKTSKK